MAKAASVVVQRCKTGGMTTALIPAAGASVRLGQPKQFVQVDGEALVHRAARLALEAGCTRVLVVEGAVPLKASLASLPVEIVRCVDWAAGPGASLRAGARAAADDEALLVLLVDQWKVTADQLRALIAAPGDVAAAAYAGGLGVPARFGPSLGWVLRELADDQGAKGWLRREAARVTAVPMPEAEVDLDTPAQLERLRLRGAKPA